MKLLTRDEPVDNTLSAAIPSLVDARVGIVRYVRELRRSPGSPNFFHIAAEACNTAAFTGQANFNLTGGAANRRDRAVLKAVGEAVERYCSAIYNVNDLPVSTSAEADFSCVEPSDFALFSPAQYASPGFSYVPFTRDSPVRWTAAREAPSGEVRYVPAAMVYMPYYYYQGAGDSPIVPPISTGLACHSSLPRATLAGGYEVIERDAFTITWQSRIAPPQIRLETLDDESFDLVRRFEDTRSSVFLFDLRLDHGVPTILAVLRSPHEDQPALVFATAASLDPADAARNVLEELAHTRRYIQEIKKGAEQAIIEADFANVISQRDHLLLHADHANAHLAEFLFSSSVYIEFDAVPDLSTGDPTTDLGLLTNCIQAVGHTLLVADLTTPDVRDLGLAVVRVIIPGFHPLFMGHRTRALGGRRLWRVPQRLGYPGVDPLIGDNPAPHPYP